MLSFDPAKLLFFDTRPKYGMHVLIVLRGSKTNVFETIGSETKGSKTNGRPKYDMHVLSVLWGSKTNGFMNPPPPGADKSAA